MTDLARQHKKDGEPKLASSGKPVPVWTGRSSLGT